MAPTEAADEPSRWYDEHAAEYQAQTQSAELVAAERCKFLRRLGEAGGAAGGTVLDLGAGAGRDALAFSQAGLTVRACDASASMTALASSHSGVCVVSLNPPSSGGGCINCKGTISAYPSGPGVMRWPLSACGPLCPPQYSARCRILSPSA